MLKRQLTAAITATTILFGGAATVSAPDAHAATTPYYQYHGQVSANVLKDKYLKPAVDHYNFKYDGVKLGDSYKQVKETLKKQGLTMKAVDKEKTLFQVDNAQLSFNKGYLDTLSINFKSGKVTRNDVEKTIGQPVSKKMSKPNEINGLAYLYNKTPKGPEFVVNFKKVNGTYQATSLMMTKK